LVHRGGNVKTFQKLLGRWQCKYYERSQVWSFLVTVKFRGLWILLCGMD